MKMKIKTIIIMYLAIISLFIFACTGSSTSDERKATDSASKVVIELESKEQLIEMILNNSDLIRFSKMSLVREKFDTVYMFIAGSDARQMDIRQEGHPVKVLKDLTGVDSSETPCYIFKKLDISKDGKSADIFLTFDLTGAIAEGRLVRDNGKWFAEKGFFIGTR